MGFAVKNEESGFEFDAIWQLAQDVQTSGDTASTVICASVRAYTEGPPVVKN